jgi:hypothetical protein
MPASLLVDTLEIRVAQKSRGARESGCFLWRHGKVVPGDFRPSFFRPSFHVAIPQRDVSHRALVQRRAAEGLDCGSERH